MSIKDPLSRLRAGLDADGRIARAAAGAPWEAGAAGRWIHVVPEAIAENKLAFGHLGYVGSIERDADREHVARQDPARVLRQGAALQRVLALRDTYTQALAQNLGGDDRLRVEAGIDALDGVLEALAGIYFEEQP